MKILGQKFFDFLHFLDATVLWKLKLSDLCVSILIFVLFLGIRRVVLCKTEKILERQPSSYVQVCLLALKKPLGLFLILVALFFSIGYLPLEPARMAFVVKIFKGGSVLSLVWVAVGLVDCLSLYCKERAEKKGDKTLMSFCPFLEKALRIGIVVLGVLVVADNLGYSMNGVFATFGLSGAALAIASKDVLANFFNSLSIVVDQPFRVGDSIQIGSIEGTVESIGVRSTRIRTLDQSLLTLPNNTLVNERIYNWTSVQKRRVKQVLGLSYETTAEKMTQLIQDIRNLLEQEKDIEKNSIWVSFSGISQNSLEIFITYLTIGGDWNLHMLVRQSINLKVLELCKMRQVSFAFLPVAALFPPKTEN